MSTTKSSFLQRIGTAVRALTGRDFQLRDIYSYRNPSVFFSLGKNAPAVSQDTSMSIATTYACVTGISKMISMLPMKVMQKTANGPVELTDHPAHKLLKVSPNGQITSMQWRETNLGKLLLSGKGYNRIFRDRYFQPVEIFPIDSSKVETLVDKSDGVVRVKKYRYEGKDLEPHDILPFIGFSLDGVQGLSPIGYLRETFSLALQQTEAATKLYQNGMRPSGFLKTDYAFGREEEDRLLASFTENYVGAVNSGKIIPLPKGVEFLKGEAISPADAQFLEGAKFTTTQIANIFGYPLHLIGGGDKVPAWGTGIAQMQVGFLTNCLQPWIIRLETACDLHLLSAEDRAKGVYTKIITEGFVRSDPIVQMSLFIQGLSSGIYSINEVRAWMDLNQLPDAIGGVHRISGTSASQVPGVNSEATDEAEEEELDRAALSAILKRSVNRRSSNPVV